MSTLAYIILLLNILNVCFCQTETVTTRIPQGELRGSVKSTVNGLKYYSFQGIPFAKPPVGDLRFKVSNNGKNQLGKRILGANVNSKLD